MSEELETGQEEVLEAVEEEVETPAEDDPEAQNEDQADEDESEDQGDGEEEPEEIEFDLGGGQKVKFPSNASAKEVAEEAQRAFKAVEGNYTRKSQEVAERAKAIEARESAVEKLQSLNGEALDAYSRGLQLKADIEQLQNQDMNALWQSNPDQARRVSDLISQKQAEFQQVVSTVTQKETELTQAQQAEMQRRIADGESKIEAKVKGFKTEKLPEVIDYAVSNLGLSREQAEKDWALNPDVTLAVWKAAQYDKMQSAAKKTSPKPKQAAPVKGRSSKGGKSQKDFASMTPAEMDRYLNH